MPNLRHWQKKLCTSSYIIQNVNIQLLYMISAANTITLQENYDEPIKLVSEPWTLLNTYTLHLQIAVIKRSAFYCHNSSRTVQNFINFFQWNKIKYTFANKATIIKILKAIFLILWIAVKNKFTHHRMTDWFFKKKATKLVFRAAYYLKEWWNVSNTEKKKRDRKVLKYTLETPECHS